MAISTQIDHLLQGDLLVGLSRLVHRNRLAVVVLAAHLAGAGSRTLSGAAESAAARWLARNAQALLLFLRSLLILESCAGHAGYRAIEARRRPIRRRRAPRLLRARLDRRLPRRADFSLGLVRQRPRYVISLC